MLRSGATGRQHERESRVQVPEISDHARQAEVERPQTQNREDVDV